VRHMREQTRVGRARGIKQTVFQKNGDLVRLAPGKPGKFAQVRAGRLVLDGDIIAPADGEAMIMRRRLALNGMVAVAVDESNRAKVAALGLPLDEDYDSFVAEAEADVAAALRKLKPAERGDLAKRTEAARLAARRAAQRWSGKKPQVQVMMMED
jgi:ribonuclease J